MNPLCCYACAVRLELKFQRAKSYEEGVCATCGMQGLMARKEDISQKLHE
jgi:rRNA maturation endonuclease Nob1